MGLTEVFKITSREPHYDLDYFRTVFLYSPAAYIPLATGYSALHPALAFSEDALDKLLELSQW